MFPESQGCPAHCSQVAHAEALRAAKLNLNACRRLNASVGPSHAQIEGSWCTLAGPESGTGDKGAAGCSGTSLEEPAAGAAGCAAGAARGHLRQPSLRAWRAHHRRPQQPRCARCLINAVMEESARKQLLVLLDAPLVQRKAICGNRSVRLRGAHNCGPQQAGCACHLPLSASFLLSKL